MAKSKDIWNKMLDYVVQSLDIQFASRETWRDTRAYNWQSIRALAWVYVCSDTQYKKASQVAESIEDVYQAILNSDELPDNRLTGQLVASAEILKEGGCLELVSGIEGLIEKSATHFEKMIDTWQHLSHFTSTNCKTSTNHVAVYACSLYKAGEYLGREEWIKQALSLWDRLAADQHPDGYWAETSPGPTPAYNNLTTCCAGRMALWTGQKNFYNAAQKGALFHRRFSYPDGCNLESIDGRVRYGQIPAMWGGFVQSETPEGRAFVLKKLETLEKRNPPSTQGTHGGEQLALLCENLQFWKHGPVGKAESERENYVEILQEPGGIRRQGPWTASLQGIQHQCRGQGGFTIDRTGIFSLWHEKTGLIINASGEQGNHEAQSFYFFCDGKEKQLYSVPDTAFVEMGEAGSQAPAKITAEYRGGTVIVQVHFLSETQLRLDIDVRTRTVYYPIPFTLPVELRAGNLINGNLLGLRSRRYYAEDLEGKIETEKFKMTFPAKGAEFIWPHDPYNPYDTKNHRSPLEKYVSLLKMPVYPGGLSVTFEI